MRVRPAANVCQPCESDLAPFEEGGSTGSRSAVLGTGDEQPRESNISDNFGEKTSWLKVKRRPYTPTEKEISEHEATHYPYRAWCRYCVAAAGRRDAHAATSQDNRDEDILTVSVDYAFFNDESVVADTGHTPILITKGRNGAIFADTCLEKGANWFSVDRLVDHILWLGEARIKLRSDGEPAIRGLCEKVAEKLKAKGVAVVPDKTPKGDSNAASLHESAVHQWKCKTRMLWQQACELHGVASHTKNHRLMAWVIQYAAQLINLTVVSADGRTAWNKITGRKEFPRPLIPWGEKVLWIPGGGKAKPGIEPKWLEGIFVGLVDLSNEYLVGTPEGIFKTASMKRMTKEGARDPVLFSAVQGTPWKLTPSSITGARQDDAPVVRASMQSNAVPQSELPVPTGRAAEAGPRRVYIRKGVELARYGYTDHCKGCEAAATNASRAVVHSDECRLRIEREMRTEIDPLISDRVVQAQERREEAMSAPQAESSDVAVTPAAANGDAEMVKSDVPVTDERKPSQKRSAEDAPDDPRLPSAGDELKDDATMEDFWGFFNLDLGDADLAHLNLVSHGNVDPTPSKVSFLTRTPLNKHRDMDLMSVPVAKSQRPHVAEIFCPPRFTKRAPKHDLNPGLSMDLRTGWDLDDPRHVEAAWKYLKEAKPYLLIGSPECKAFSKLAQWNFDKPGYQDTLKLGMKHLKLCMEMYSYQVSQGRLFVHEHPAGATSWGLPAVQQLLRMPGVVKAYVDQCMFGQTAVKNGVEFPAKKPTIFATNSKFIAEALERKCRSGHEHVSLLNGLAIQCNAYPDALVDAALRGLKKELESMGRLMALEGGGVTIDEIPPETPWIATYYDEITGAILDPTLVQNARKAEIEYMHKLQVYVESTLDECHRYGLKPIPMRWIDINKGDNDNPNIRCRAVLQETRGRSDLGPNDITSTFAGTPPLEGLKAIVSMSMSGQQGVPMRARKVLGFYDVSRAHFHSPAKRRMYVKTLPEDKTIQSGIARLLKAMYGGRDAGNCWDDFSEKVMRSLGFTEGVFSTCLYYNAKQDTCAWRHGDDFVVLATRTQHAQFHAEANKQMILKQEGILGPLKEAGDKQEVRCLNRLLRYVQPPFRSADEGYVEWESDPRHCEILMSQLGLKADSKKLGQPCVKLERNADLNKLNESDHKLYRSATMRLAYIAQDRPDLQFTSKELARYMQEPTSFDLQQLKRAARYLHGAGRLVQRFEQQATPKGLTAYTDSDFAGCVRTRKSTSCSMVFWGKHLIKSTSTTQAIISLSSGEAEFYAAVKGSSIALGCQAMFADMGVKNADPPKILVDSTACLGIAGRKGAGRVRHIHTPTLWLQRAASEGRLKLSKVLGTDNPADIGTKALQAASLQKILKMCGFRVTGAISKMALRAQV